MPERPNQQKPHLHLVPPPEVAGAPVPEVDPFQARVDALSEKFRAAEAPRTEQQQSVDRATERHDRTSRAEEARNAIDQEAIPGHHYGHEASRGHESGAESAEAYAPFGGAPTADELAQHDKQQAKHTKKHKGHGHSHEEQEYKQALGELKAMTKSLPEMFAGPAGNEVYTNIEVLTKVRPLRKFFLTAKIFQRNGLSPSGNLAHFSGFNRLVRRNVTTMHEYGYAPSGHGERDQKYYKIKKRMKGVVLPDQISAASPKHPISRPAYSLPVPAANPAVWNPKGGQARRDDFFVIGKNGQTWGGAMLKNSDPNHRTIGVGKDIFPLGQNKQPFKRTWLLPITGTADWIVGTIPFFRGYAPRSREPNHVGRFMERYTALHPHADPIDVMAATKNIIGLQNALGEIQNYALSPLGTVPPPPSLPPTYMGSYHKYGSARSPSRGLLK